MRRAAPTQQERERSREQRMLQRVMATTARAAAVYARSAEAVLSPGRAAMKTPNRVDKGIRDSARGEECLVRIPGVCSGDPEKTIWSHAPIGAAGKGRSLKALDLCGAYCCTACDAVVDGQAVVPGVSRELALMDWMYGHLRSLVRLRQRGLV